jgi:hypothetical protein
MQKKTFLLIVCVCLMVSSQACTAAGEVSAAVTEASAQPQTGEYSQPLVQASGEVVDPLAFKYLGAFRLPGEEDRPRTFAYGGNAMTFYPNGDPNGAADGFPGSLFIMGHDRIAYGDLPDGNQVAEISIPEPVISGNLEDLNTAEFLQDFENVLAGRFTNLEEIPRVGMAYLNRTETGENIHFGWGQHLQEPGDASHGWFNPQLDNPQVQGFWHIDELDPYSTTGYIFEIPAEWAENSVNGYYLATGRYRDGGMGGMGPSLIAYMPWLEDGSPAPDGAHLEALPLLLYENSYNTIEIVNCLNGYQHPDEWEGGAWITTASGDSAVLFAGTKSTGEKYWYGYIHPDGPQYVCVDDKVEDIADMCRYADGSFCPEEELGGCCDEEAGTCVSNRGWWSTRFDAQLILYDPAELAGVAAGELEPWQPQPYTVIDIDEYLYLSPPEWDQVDIGWGDQRRNRIGEVSFDRQNGLLYVLELYVDDAKPVVHVWKVE